jgi:hypothetical protein
MPPPKNPGTILTGGVELPNLDPSKLKQVDPGPHPTYLCGVFSKSLNRELTETVNTRVALMVTKGTIRDMRVYLGKYPDIARVATVNEFLDDYLNDLLDKAKSGGGGGADDEAILQGP